MAHDSGSPHLIETYNTINQRLADSLDIPGEWPEKLDI